MPENNSHLSQYKIITAITQPKLIVDYLKYLQNHPDLKNIIVVQEQQDTLKYDSELDYTLEWIIPFWIFEIVLKAPYGSFGLNTIIPLEETIPHLDNNLLDSLCRLGGCQLVRDWFKENGVNI